MFPSRPTPRALIRGHMSRYDVKCLNIASPIAKSHRYDDYVIYLDIKSLASVSWGVPHMTSGCYDVMYDLAATAYALQKQKKKNCQGLERHTQRDKLPLVQRKTASCAWVHPRSARSKRTTTTRTTFLGPKPPRRQGPRITSSLVNPQPSPATNTASRSLFETLREARAACAS